MKYNKYISDTVLSLVLILPLASNADVTADLAALDVRVTNNESDISAASNRLAQLESPLQIIDSDASRIFLKKNCTEANEPINNCFTSMASVNSWISSNPPSETSPTLVDIGPGQFDQFTCQDAAWITLRGSGKGNTVISKGTTGGGPPTNYGVSLNNCSNVTIQDLKISNGRNALKVNNNVGTGTNLVFQNIDIETTLSNANTILWFGDGSSKWLNVNVTGSGDSGSWVWTDDCQSTERPSHYWFGSTITSSSTGLYNVTYKSNCGDSWFYGSEISAFATGGNNLRNEAVELDYDASIQLFGSLVRTIIQAGVSQTGGFPVRAVNLNGNSIFHMHGGIISAIASNGGSVDRGAVGIAINSSSSASAHVLETAFNIKPKGNGDKVRIQSGATSPFQWPADDTPPVNLISVKGADTFVETDCYANGDCETTGGTETHMMIYNQSCNTAGNWFDSTTGRCRGLTN